MPEHPERPQTYLLPLNFQYMQKMDRGRIGILFEHHVRAVTADILDRPTDAAGKPHPRKIIVELELTPEVKIDPDDRTARVQAITGDVKVKSKVPVHRSVPIAFGVARGDMLFFNPDVPGREGLHQPVLPGMGHESEGSDEGE